MSDELKLYVKINHKQLISVDRIKTPNLFKFCTEHIEEMMNVLQQDIIKYQKYVDELEKSKKEGKKFKEKKIQVPIAYLKQEEFKHLCKGININPIVAMTLCFGKDNFLCDIRLDPEDMRMQQLKKMSEGKTKVDKDVKIIEMKPQFKMPKYPLMN